jgi:hypothetical protein
MSGICFEEAFGTIVKNMVASGLVDAIFEYSKNDVTTFYLVATEHTMPVYDALNRVDTYLFNTWPKEVYNFAIHVRAHQGRPPEDAVPPGCTLVWSRDAGYGPSYKNASWQITVDTERIGPF